jgi:hypothetical protein
MRHFAAPEAGNWGTFERIKVAVFESVQALGRFAFIFYLWIIIQP